jgi:hypothetical protein
MTAQFEAHLRQGTSRGQVVLILRDGHCGTTEQDRQVLGASRWAIGTLMN